MFDEGRRGTESAAFQPRTRLVMLSRKVTGQFEFVLLQPVYGLLHKVMSRVAKVWGGGGKSEKPSIVTRSEIARKGKAR